MRTRVKPITIKVEGYIFYSRYYFVFLLKHKEMKINFIAYSLTMIYMQKICVYVIYRSGNLVAIS